MAEAEWLAERFEEHRSRLRAVAYRMLGSLTDADDAVQDAWVRVSRARGRGRWRNLGGWLTTASCPGVPEHVARSQHRPTRGTGLGRTSSGSRSSAPPGDLAARGGGAPGRLGRPGVQVVLDTLARHLGGWRSCSMTCSNFPSRRSPRWSGAHRMPPGSWPAGLGAEYVGPTPQCPIPVRRPACGRRRLLPRRAMATSRPSSPCSTRMWSALGLRRDRSRRHEGDQRRQGRRRQRDSVPLLPRSFTRLW